MSPHEISAILDRPTSQELLARDVLRLAYVAKTAAGGAVAGLRAAVATGPAVAWLSPPRPVAAARLTTRFLRCGGDCPAPP